MPASEERSLHEFPSAMSILATTLLWVSTVAPSSTSGYDSEKTTAGDLALAILGDFEFTQDLFTNVKTIFGAINSIMCLYGNAIPSASQGTDGQFYVKYTSSGGTDTVDGLYWKINSDWVEISTGGGGGGASVTLGTTVPSDASGSNGDLYVQYDGTTYAVIEYFVKINGSWRKSPYSRVVALTQAEYDLITPDPTTLYIITDAQSSYQTKTDANLDTTADTVVGAINELNTGKADASTTYTKTEVEDLLDDKAKSINVVWANSCESSFTTRSQFLVIEASSGFYTVWFASTNQINVKEWTTNTVASGVDTVTLSNLKFERINKTGVTDEYKLRISANSSTAFTIIN